VCPSSAKYVALLRLSKAAERTHIAESVGLWTKADSVTEFADLEAAGTPAP